MRQVPMKTPIMVDLWNSATSGAGIFPPVNLASIPEPARRYLEHAIAPGTRLASAVRLRMRGEIKLGRWFRFRAEQVIHARRGFTWTATVPVLGLPLIRGFDRLLDGAGEMRWKLLGLMPIMTASGPDITRASAGRFEIESFWLPSVLVGEEVRWSSTDARHAAAAFGREPEPVEFEIDDHGVPRSVRMRRWSNPGGGSFGLVDFGGVLESEATFGGYTIPTRVRAGWYFGTSRFESEGEFFRATIEGATFR
jgi:uncharacterized protein DUF6920